MSKSVDPTFLGNIAILAHKGFSVSQIAAATETTYARVRSTLETYNIPFTNHQGRTKKIREEYRELMKAGGSSGKVRLQLAAKFGVHLSLIYRATR